MVLWRSDLTVLRKSDLTDGLKLPTTSRTVCLLKTLKTDPMVLQPTGLTVLMQSGLTAWTPTVLMKFLNCKTDGTQYVLTRKSSSLSQQEIYGMRNLRQVFVQRLCEMLPMMSGILHFLTERIRQSGMQAMQSLSALPQKSFSLIP